MKFRASTAIFNQEGSLSQSLTVKKKQQHQEKNQNLDQIMPKLIPDI